MDPIFTIAAASEVVSLAASVVKTCYEYIQAVRQLQRQVRVAKGEIEQLSRLLRTLISALNLEQPKQRASERRNEESDELHRDEKVEILMQIQGCKALLEGFQTTVEDAIPQGMWTVTAAVHRVAHPLTKDTIEQYLHSFSEHIASIQFLLDLFRTLLSLLLS